MTCLPIYQLTLKQCPLSYVRQSVKVLHFLFSASLISSIYNAGFFIHLRYHIYSHQCLLIYNIFSHLVSCWVCGICFSSFIVSAFSNVWTFAVILRFPIESSIISIWVAPIERERNCCHASYSVLHSVKVWECADCHSVAKTLWYCQPPRALSHVSLSYVPTLTTASWRRTPPLLPLPL